VVGRKIGLEKVNVGTYSRTRL